MTVVVKAYAYGLEMFVSGARFGQEFRVELREPATIAAVLARLGIPANVFALLLNGRHASPSTLCAPNDRIDLLEAINGG